jgi:hypothetical protein
LPRVAEFKADSDTPFFIFNIFGLDLIVYFRDSFTQCRSPPSISVFEPSGHRMTAIPCLWMGYQSILRISALGDDFIRINFGLFMIRCTSSSGSPRKSSKKTMSERRNECSPHGITINTGARKRYDASARMKGFVNGKKGDRNGRKTSSRQRADGKLKGSLMESARTDQFLKNFLTGQIRAQCRAPGRFRTDWSQKHSISCGEGEIPVRRCGQFAFQQYLKKL